MKIENIHIDGCAEIDDSSTINNCRLGDGVKIAKRCSVFGSSQQPILIGKNVYIGMNSLLNGFDEQLEVGDYVSIASNVTIMTGSGPNASSEMQKYYPIIKGSVKIGAHSWIGDNVSILPNVVLGDFCVVATNSVVTRSFDSYSVIGGNPARLIKKLPKIED